MYDADEKHSRCVILCVRSFIYIDVVAFQNQYLQLNASSRQRLGRMEVLRPTSKLNASLPTLRVQQTFGLTMQPLR